LTFRPRRRPSSERSV